MQKTYLFSVCISLCQMGRVWASRPAKKSGRSVKEKKVVTPMWCIYMCAHVCHVALLCYSRLQKKAPVGKSETLLFIITRGDFEWIFHQFFCIKLLLYLSTTVRKIKNLFFLFIIYIVIFLLGVKKRIIFCQKFACHCLDNFFSHESKGQKSTLYI